LLLKKPSDNNNYCIIGVHSGLDRESRVNRERSRRCNTGIFVLLKEIKTSFGQYATVCFSNGKAAEEKKGLSQKTCR
jgi:hypothetical protein